MSVHSPFRYPGGKYYARKLIIDYIPLDHHAYYEPFAGGASIFFAKAKVSRNVLNDFDGDLIRTYHVIRDQPEQLIAFLDGIPASKELHNHYKNEFTPTNDVEKAGRWYYLNRISYSGIMNMPNCFWGYGDKKAMRPENWPRAIRAASQKLQDVAITCEDFEQVIDGAEDGAFLFVDPPYFNADQDKFYTKSFVADDHQRLSAVLARNARRLHFLLTYDNSPEVRALYAWAPQQVNKEWTYCLDRTDDQKTKTESKGSRQKGQEIFILNYSHDLIFDFPTNDK